MTALVLNEKPQTKTDRIIGRESVGYAFRPFTFYLHDLITAYYAEYTPDEDSDPIEVIRLETTNGDKIIKPDLVIWNKITKYFEENERIFELKRKKKLESLELKSAY